jgi:hypothetical protein
MAAKRYVVLNASNKVINSILIDDPIPKGYWPGYGKTLVPLEPVTFTKGGAGLDIVVFDKWPVVPQIGDTIDLTTGTVTKFVAPITGQKDEKGDPVLDEKGNLVMVASAPIVKLTTDAAPKPEGTVTTKTTTTDIKVSK